VLPGFTAALTSFVFHETLGWVDHIDGHHLGLVLLNALALLLFCLYSCALLGKGAGIAATLCLALFPTALGHTPNNAKDWPCAQFYGVTLLAAGLGVVRERARHLLAAGVLLGVALSCKMNAVFVLPTVLLFAPVAYFALYFRKKPIPAGVAAGFLAAPYVAAIVFFALWPWLWYGRLPDWWSHVNEYVSFMVNYGSGKREGFSAYSLKCVALMTPPLVLVCAGAFVVQSVRAGREALATAALLALWFALPVLRIALPRSNFYDGNRHFLEYVPALCAMAGAGAAFLHGWLARFFSRRGGALAAHGRRAALVTFATGILWPVAAYHPYEATYFNFLIGGLGGAQRSGLFAMPPPSDIRVNGTEGDYWFTSARVGARELRKLMKPGDKLSMCGPGRGHAQANWGVEPIPHLYEAHEPEFPSVEYMFVSPRETLCWWRQVRKFESERPILKRVERGGGLIYEILGPKSGSPKPPVSPETWYERNVHPADREGLEWQAARVKAGVP
jgi:hypothetical protein